MLILAGDVGGTNSRFGLFRPGDTESLALVWSGTWPSSEHASLPEIVRRAIRAAGARPTAMAIGVAGPVRDGVCRATNLPWVVSAAELADAAGLPSATLLNDLEASAWGIDLLGPDDVIPLQEGAPDARGNRALVAAGTGLGEAGLCFDGRRHHPFASEGGHADFAPADEGQVRIWRMLRREHGHVSWERLVSGPGLRLLYDAVVRSGEFPGALRLAVDAPPADISAAALERADPLACAALDLFVSLYGAEAGNVALKFLATGGVYIGGGIAPRIAPWFRSPGFLSAFLGKGRMRPLLEAMPVRLIVDPHVALRGAARRALEARS